MHKQRSVQEATASSPAEAALVDEPTYIRISNATHARLVELDAPYAHAGYMALVEAAGHTGRAYTPKRATLARYACCLLATVKRVLAKLESAGLITIQTR